MRQAGFGGLVLRVQGEDDSLSGLTGFGRSAPDPRFPGQAQHALGKIGGGAPILRLDPAQIIVDRDFCRADLTGGHAVDGREGHGGQGKQQDGKGKQSHRHLRCPALSMTGQILAPPENNGGPG